MAIEIASLTLYKLRYWIGYSLVGLMMIGLLATVALYSPGALSLSELESLKNTSVLNSTNLADLGIVNLPYHLLQHASLSIFGVSEISIKLPSLILGLVSAVGILLLLREWFKRNIAVISTVVAISTGQFLFLSQSGTPDIMYLFWPIWILLFATYVAKKKPRLMFNKIMLFIALALSLYTPLAIYTVAAITITIVLHPHLRYLLKQLNKKLLILAIFFGLLAMVPLLVAIYRNPSIVLDLLGIPTSFPNIIENITKLFNLYFGFSSSSSSEILVPVFGMGALVVMLIGFYRLYETRSATQSYLINTWILFIVPLMILNPTMTAITLAPAVLLIATGIEGIVGYWYSLFPRNPYARVGGLLPILALVFMLSASGLERYVYGYHYNPNLRANFTKDVSILDNKKSQIVVADSETELYQTISKYEKELDLVKTPTADEVVYTREAAVNPPAGYSIKTILTSDMSSSSDRFYVYKKNAG